MRAQKVLIPRYMWVPGAPNATFAQGDVACWLPGYGVVIPANPEAPTLVPAGFVTRDVALGADGGLVPVDLQTPRPGLWLVNTTDEDAVGDSNVGNLCYFVGADSVAASDGGVSRPVAGRVWGVRGLVVLVDPNDRA